MPRHLTDFDFPSKHNLSATTNPAVSNDSSQGYEDGSIWVNTSTDAAYICSDNSVGAAIWKNISADGSLIASTQWARTLPAPVPLPNGSIANGFTFFDNVADKVAGGTTSYSELNIAFGITITLSGTSGTATITIDGVGYPLIFDTDLFTTANNFVLANQSTLNALDVRLFALGSGTDGRIRFCASEATLNAITITNVTPDLTGTIANEFTGSPTASGDHCLIPYVGEPYEGLRIHQTIRANFNIDTGSVQYAELGIYRYADDTQIGSGITILRNPDVTGNLVVIETYTSSASDPFVLGGFYIALNNQSGTSLDFIGASGILIQSTFQKLVNFT